MSNYSNIQSNILNKKLSEIPSIFDWGVNGNNTGDDSVGVNKAIADMSASGGGDLLVPGGYNYRLANPITFGATCSKVRLIGNGMSSVFKRAANMPANKGVIDIVTGATNIVIDGIKIDGGVTTSVGLKYGLVSGGGDFDNNPCYANLLLNSSVWVHSGTSKISFINMVVTHTGGYAVFIDAQTGDIVDVVVDSCVFENNRPHLFGTTTGDLTYGSWTGGIHYQGDGASTGASWSVKNMAVTNNIFRRNTGNCVWGHVYGFNSIHQNLKVDGNHFEDCGLDCVEMGAVSGGSVHGNTLRRIGYICSDDTSASTPKYLSGVNATGLDTSGFCAGVNYSDNSLLSVYGGFMDLDGFCDGMITGNICRVPDSTEIEYAQDQIASWAGNYSYGVQTGNTSLNSGGKNVSIVGNTFLNMGQAAIRLFCSRGGYVSGNNIVYPANGAYAPIIIGNTGIANTQRSCNNTIVSNTIQWSPSATTSAIQEFNGASLPWLSTDRNWVSDNRLFGNMTEFAKDSSSNSITGTLVATDATSLFAKAARVDASTSFTGGSFQGSGVAVGSNGIGGGAFLIWLGSSYGTVISVSGTTITGGFTQLYTTDLTASGSIFMGGGLVATQAWTTSGFATPSYADTAATNAQNYCLGASYNAFVGHLNSFHGYNASFSLTAPSGGGAVTGTITIK